MLLLNSRERVKILRVSGGLCPGCWWCCCCCCWGCCCCFVFSWVQVRRTVLPNRWHITIWNSGCLRSCNGIVVSTSPQHAQSFQIYIWRCEEVTPGACFWPLCTQHDTPEETCISAPAQKNMALRKECDIQGVALQCHRLPPSHETAGCWDCDVVTLVWHLLQVADGHADKPSNENWHKNSKKRAQMMHCAKSCRHFAICKKSFTFMWFLGRGKCGTEIDETKVCWSLFCCEIFHSFLLSFHDWMKRKWIRDSNEQTRTTFVQVTSIPHASPSQSVVFFSFS